MISNNRTLLSDEDGAILVAGLFVSAFLVGALYMLIGASTAMRHGELMQDGVDSSTFTSAQLQAKGMNLIALGNQAKVSALSVSTASPAIAAGTAETIEWIIASPFRLALFGQTLPELVIIYEQALLHYEEGDSVREIIDATDKMQNTLASDLSDVSIDILNTEVQPTYSGAIELFYAESTGASMPVEDEPLADTCARAFPYAETIAQNSLENVLIPQVRSETLRRIRRYIIAYCLANGSPAKTITPGAVPGGEAFQVRTYALGKELSKLGERGVAIADRQGTSPNEVTNLRDTLSTTSFAQAELFFEGPTTADEALWQPQWRARLRRYRPTSPRPEIPQGMEWAIVH